MSNKHVRKKRTKKGSKRSHVLGWQRCYLAYVKQLPGIPSPAPFVVDATQRVANSRTTGPGSPDWRKRIAIGQDATTSLTGVRFRMKASEGEYSGYQKTNPKNIFSQKGHILPQMTVGWPAACSAPVVNQAISKSQIKFAKKYREATQQNFSGGVFVGQLLQTVRELSRPAKGIRDAIDTLHTDLSALYRERMRINKYGRTMVRDKNSWRELTHAVSDTWLEWVFGHKANIQDLDDAAKAFKTMADADCYDLIPIKAGGMSEATVSGQVLSYTPASSLPSATFHQNVFKDGYEQCYSTIRGAWRNDNPSGTMPIPGQFGIGVLDVLPTAWELVPWSFFADYFINIGQVLDAWQMRFVTFAWMNRTTRSSRTDKFSDLCRDSSVSFAYDDSLSYGGHVEKSRFDVNRGTINSTWETGFMVKVPGFDSASGRGRWLNIAALLTMGIKPHTPRSIFR